MMSVIHQEIRLFLLGGELVKYNGVDMLKRRR